MAGATRGAGRGIATMLGPVTALAVTPGFLRSEAMLERFGVTEATWQEAGKKDPHFLSSETPYFVGRAIAALAADSQVSEKAGRVFTSWDLSDEYGFSDIDGRRPHWGRHVVEAFGQAFTRCDDGFYAYCTPGPVDLLFGDWP